MNLFSTDTQMNAKDIKTKPIRHFLHVLNGANWLEAIRFSWIQGSFFLWNIEIPKWYTIVYAGWCADQNAVIIVESQILLLKTLWWWAYFLLVLTTISISTDIDQRGRKRNRVDFSLFSLLKPNNFNQMPEANCLLVSPRSCVHCVFVHR